MPLPSPDVRRCKCLSICCVISILSFFGLSRVVRLTSAPGELFSSKVLTTFLQDPIETDPATPSKVSGTDLDTASEDGDLQDLNVSEVGDSDREGFTAPSLALGDFKPEADVAKDFKTFSVDEDGVTKIAPVSGPECRCFGKHSVFFHPIDRLPKKVMSKKVAGQYGLVFAASAQTADVVFASSRDKKVKKDLAKGRAAILLMRTDSTTMGSDHDLLEHPRVIGMFREFAPRRREQYFWPWFKSRIHYFKICNSTRFRTNPICDRPKQFKPKHVVRAGVDKIRVVNLIWWQYFPILEKPIQDFDATPDTILDKPRPIDVFVAVHLRNDDPYSLQRSALRETLADPVLSGLKQVQYFCYEGESEHWKATWNKVVHGLNCLKGDQYMSYLRQSKIVICAWGFGERTGCEHGGWVHGALVVKPESDWVLSLPDMYRSNATYVAVKADWSDLPTTLRHVLANYDGYKGMRAYARQTFLRNATHKKFLDHFWRSTCAAIEQTDWGGCNKTRSK
ncbi:unnamed protein product [Symbiodinium sp. CCMP2592]|nr:unnamed protein product [Symbiodinium sp. CCMP2592]